MGESSSVSRTRKKCSSTEKQAVHHRLLEVFKDGKVFCVSVVGEGSRRAQEMPSPGDSSGAGASVFGVGRRGRVYSSVVNSE